MKRRGLAPVREEPPGAAGCPRELLSYAAAVLVALASFANSLDGEFVHDDIPAVVNNEDVTGANPLAELFVNDFWGTPMADVASHKSYRPLTIITFRLNYLACGHRPWWWHACNVLLHAACCVLVLRTCTRVAGLQPPAATLAAIFFAVHPIHTEAVSGVVGRADVLACFFFLSSLLLYHGRNGGRPRVWTSVILATFAMCAKETGVTVLPLNLALDIYRTAPELRRSIIKRGGRWSGRVSRLIIRARKILVALTLLLVVRLALLQGSSPTFSQQDNPAACHPSLLVRFLTLSYLAAFNLWLIVCPSMLSHDWQMGSIPLVYTPLDPRNLLTCAALAIILMLAYRALGDLEYQRRKPLVLGLLLLAIPFVPSSNLFVTVGFVVAERVLYIPSVGYAILTAYGAQLAWRALSPPLARRAMALLGTALLVSATFRTYQRNYHWTNKETLLRADLSTLSHNAKLHYNYANLLRDKENTEKAIEHYKEALRFWPSYASAHNNLGTLMVREGRAEHHFLEAIKYSKDHVNAHFNLGKIYRKSNRTTDASALLERCVSLAPRFVLAYEELILLKDLRERGPLLRKLVTIEPQHVHRYIAYAEWLRNYGLRTLVLKFLLHGLKVSFKSKETNRSHRTDLKALLAAAVELRSAGQKSRILQLIARWHAQRRGRYSFLASTLHLREWRLRLEMTRRSGAYLQLLTTQPAAVRCLDHSHFDVCEKKSQQEDKQVHKNYIIHVGTSTKEVNVRDIRRIVELESTKKIGQNIPVLYKHTHNKSDDGHKKISVVRPGEENQVNPPIVTASPFMMSQLVQTS